MTLGVKCNALRGETLKTVSGRKDRIVSNFITQCFDFQYAY